MFEKIFYLRDATTSLYWDGTIPGTFTLKPEKFWTSREDADSRFNGYLQYHAKLKMPKSPLSLEMMEHDVILSPASTNVLNNETNPRAFFIGRIRRDFDSNRWDSPYGGLIYLIGREKAPHLIPYWCKLKASPWKVAQENGNSALLDMIQRSICIKSNLSNGSNPWVGLKDAIDYTFLKLSTPILITIITEDYLS